MIRYTVTLTQVGDLISVDISAPPGHASPAEIQAAELFRQKIREFQEQTRGIFTRQFGPPRNDRGN